MAVAYVAGTQSIVTVETHDGCTCGQSIAPHSSIAYCVEHAWWIGAACCLYCHARLYPGAPCQCAQACAYRLFLRSLDVDTIITDGHGWYAYMLEQLSHYEPVEQQCHVCRVSH